jgi:hypothetical protein
MSHGVAWTFQLCFGPDKKIVGFSPIFGCEDFLKNPKTIQEALKDPRVSTKMTPPDGPGTPIMGCGHIGVWRLNVLGNKNDVVGLNVTEPWWCPICNIHAEKIKWERLTSHQKLPLLDALMNANPNKFFKLR